MSLLLNGFSGGALINSQPNIQMLENAESAKFNKICLMPCCLVDEWNGNVIL